MSFQPYDIVWAKIEWRRSKDDRPWLIADVRQGGESYGVCPISGEYYQGPRFMLDPARSEFSATGLAKPCSIFSESLLELGANEIRRFCGRLQGDLLAEFREYSGL